MSCEDDPLNDPRRLGKTEPMSPLHKGFLERPQHGEERTYRVKNGQILHDEDCDFAGEIVGRENLLGWMVDPRGIYPDRPAVCRCGANPNLAKLGIP